MIVEISLFGFGDQRPAVFGNSNSLTLTLQDATTIVTAIGKSGFTDTHGLSAIRNGVVVPLHEWPTAELADGDTLKLLMAIEGG